ncbi:hypothetical protein FRC00_003897, partial [Tulasnella sp. 408]
RRDDGPSKDLGESCKRLLGRGARWTLETAQQKTREAQAAQDLENNIEVPPPPASSLKAFEERAKSSAWHAAHPPPPPEAMPYIGVGKKFRRAA